MNLQHTKQQGLSLVELLISMAILGILLGVLTAFLIGNQRVTSNQITAASLNNDVRLAFLRISEIVAQTHYIYPAGQTLTINGASYTTGKDMLAVLVPEGTTYCDATPSGTPATYCAFAYAITDRAPYITKLGNGAGTTGFALIEFKQTGLLWTKGSQPTSVLAIWASAASSPVVDSVATTSSLAALINLEKGTSSNYDGPAVFSTTANLDTSKGIVAAVNSSLVLERTVNGKAVTVTRNNFVFSRTTPRPTQPTKQ